jgi:hypothetical protein
MATREERAFMEVAVSFVLSAYPQDVDIMDVPTLVGYADQRVLIWEPFTRRPANEVADYIDQLQNMMLEKHYQLLEQNKEEQ